ncbi:hypothetical protein [Ferrovibrio sp.]|uniref:hypothetical protein n=1 Tax=Ferrovibrio sp. TaxID=1917215 RepID=UPI0025BCA442|nr:hypothetical protein [Ferrovibrio sp.]MBX3456295.1 hypothetical protein [Ferrovibrio sp.]
MMQRWVFRVASAPRYGGGHMARSLILAHEMRSMRHSLDIGFVLDAESASWRERLAAAGFAVAEATGGISAAEDINIKVLFDHPERSLAADIKGSGLVYIDDDAAGLAGASLIIHPHADLKGEAIGGVPALCGLKYALIDSRWSYVSVPDPIKPIERILVTFGQIDTVNATEQALQALLSISNLPPIDVALGNMAAHLEPLRQRFSSHAGVQLHIGRPQIDDLVMTAGLTIGAAGVSLLERLAAGSISIAVAQNATQRRLLTALANTGAILDGGDAWNFDQSAFCHVVSSLFAKPDIRLRMRKCARFLIDGCGAKRVAKAILTLQ